MMKRSAVFPESIPAREGIFKDAFWIWPERLLWDLVNGYALFRKTFALARLPRKAPLFITADQSYRLFVNGNFVCRGPARGYQHHWPYDEVDLRPWLRRGKNVLAIRAYNPGTGNFQYISQGFAGLLVAAQWPGVRILSDSSWKARRQISARRDTARTSIQLFHQEHVDLREEEGTWTAMDFKDETWQAPAKSICGPWFALQARGISMLQEDNLSPGRLIGIGAGPSASGYHDARDVVELHNRENQGHSPSSLPNSPLIVKQMGRGRFRSYLLDFGATVVGNFKIEISGARGGEIIDTYFSETIAPATLTPALVLPNNSRVAFGNRLICRSGDMEHRFYHHFGFRYATLMVRDALKGLVLRVRLEATRYPLKRNGLFQSSDAGLNRIWETCARTQECCTLDAYVDTPWREQAQWWGDARVQAWNTFHLDGDTSIFRRGIAQIAGQTTPDGLTYGHAPTIAHSCILPDFTLIWLLTLWDYFWQTGSLEPFRTHRTQVKNALQYFRTWTDSATGLIKYDPRFWLFLDWTDLFKEGIPTVYNLWLLLALERLTILYRRATWHREAEEVNAWALRLRKSLACLVSKDGLMRDGIDRQGRIVQETSIHSQVLALKAGLKGVDAKRALNHLVLPFVEGKTRPKAFPSAYWVTYVFSLLDDHHRGIEALPFINRFWTPMAVHGTTWENYQPTVGVESHSHAWSAHPLYHLMQIVGGIRQAAPAWKEIVFRPAFHGDHNRTVVPTPKGKITADWRREKGGVDVRISLPPGIKARVELPGLAAIEVSRQGSWKLREVEATA